MFLKDSRYLGSRRFSPGPDGAIPFKGVRPRAIGVAMPVMEHAFSPGERLDALGTHFYNDARLWWRILDANADVSCAAEVELLGLAPLPGALPMDDDLENEFGEILLVPKAKE